MKDAQSKSLPHDLFEPPSLTTVLETFGNNRTPTVEPENGPLSQTPTRDEFESQVLADECFYFYQLFTHPFLRWTGRRTNC